MKKEVTAVLNLIKDLEIEEEIFHALEAELRKMPAVEESSRPKRTSNGYEIYYDESSGQPVGIVYNNVVFLRTISEVPITWSEVAEYCKSIIINGIVSELCPVDATWPGELKKISQDLYQALTEIGAGYLDHYTWCSEISHINACKWRLSDGSISLNFRTGSRSYVRPVLVLKR